MIVYSDDRILGDITSNSVRGIFGKCNDKALALGTEEAMPIGLKQEIRKGPAQILCTVDGTTRYYDIEITDIHLDHDNVNRGIELKVTDSDLIALTGGIVQGMSGAPIIQNGKFVGPSPMFSCRTVPEDMGFLLRICWSNKVAVQAVNMVK